MSLIHQIGLYALLAIIAAGLAIPGLMGMFRSSPGTDLMAGSVDALSHLRGLNGMMAAFGLIAVWAMIDLQRSRNLVMALGVVMAAVVMARLFSILKDGFPGPATWFYLAIEMVMAVVFIGYPPPGKG